MQAQCVEVAGFGDLESDRAGTVEVDHPGMGFHGKLTGGGGGRGDHAIHIPAAVAQCDLVVVWPGEQFGDQGGYRAGVLGVDVDDRGPQLGMLEDQDPHDATKLRLRQGDRVIRLDLLGSARDDPQPRVGPGGELGNRLDDLRDQHRAGLRQGELLGDAERLVRRSGWARDHDGVPRDVGSGQRGTDLFRVIGGHHLMVGSRRQARQQFRITDYQNRVENRGRLDQIRRLPHRREQPTGDSVGSGGLQHRHVDFVDLQQHPATRIGEENLPDIAVRAGSLAQRGDRSDAGSQIAVDPDPGQPYREHHRRLLGPVGRQILRDLGRAKGLHRDVHHHRMQDESSRRLLCPQGKRHLGSSHSGVRNAKADDSLERGPMLLARATQLPVQLLGIELGQRVGRGHLAGLAAVALQRGGGMGSPSGIGSARADFHSRLGLVTLQRGHHGGVGGHNHHLVQAQPADGPRTRVVGTECVCHGGECQFGVGRSGQDARVTDAVVIEPQQVRAECALPDPDTVDRIRHTDPQQGVGAHRGGGTGGDAVAGVVPGRGGQRYPMPGRAIGVRRAGGVEVGLKRDGVVGVARQGAEAVVMLLAQGVGDGMGEQRVRADLDEGAVALPGRGNRLAEADRVA